MAEFLTTRGISHHIEEIVKAAKEQITLVTPYLKFSDLLYQRLQYADSKGIRITVIYGKTDLSTQQDKRLSKLTNLNLYFLSNLHAKCYFNEETLILSSMNLYQYSEESNREMGMLIERKTDRKIFQQIIDEVESIKAASQTMKESIKSPEVIETKELDWSAVKLEYLKRLKNAFPKTEFWLEETIIHANNFPLEDVAFSTTYGFCTLYLNLNRDILKVIRNRFYEEFDGEFKDYRLFWSYPYNKVCLYSSESENGNTIDEKVKYYMNGLDKMVEAFLHIYPNKEK